MLRPHTRLIEMAKKSLIRRPAIRSNLLQLKAMTTVLREAVLDTAYYLRWAGLVESDRGVDPSPANRLAEIMKDTHKIEKGFAISNTKRPFGVRVANKIQRNFNHISELPASVKMPAEDAIATLARWNNNGTSLGDAVVVRSVDSSNLLFAYQGAERGNLLEHRSSIRSFDTSQEVADSDVREAARIASKAPSVCNRQSGRLHLYRGEKMFELLALQNGNATFRDEINAILVITVETQSFLGPHERRQLGIDGGIFALQTALSIESLGLGSCFLNWDVRERDSIRLRKAGDIPESEYVICLMAIGHPSGSALVARSSRLEVDEILSVH